jgi:hypothetical protein
LFAGFCLQSIRQEPSGGGIAFRYVPFHSVFTASHGGADILVNGRRASRVEEFFRPGTPIELAVDLQQTSEELRSRFEFLSWSDGGDRSHSITVQDVPDTITARLAASYQLRMSVRGAPLSAVTAGVTGDLVSGVYVAEGTSISLRATPQADAVFLNWTGDTISTRDTLTLPMRHPFRVLANFIAVQQVEVPAAAEALLGVSVLRAQEDLYLDAAGNRNGQYDLGDFLAMVDRSATPKLALNGGRAGPR